jgi:hypothetical protein
MRELVGVSQPVFARMLGVSAALPLMGCGQRKLAPIGADNRDANNVMPGDE